jgi:CheY-like chemotaxis protein
MPEMDGLQATQPTKARWSQVRVLVLTLYGEYEAEALAAGAEETVKVHLFERAQALVAEATALLE